MADVSCDAIHADISANRPALMKNPAGKGASGTLGRAVAAELGGAGIIVTAGRSSW